MQQLFGECHRELPSVQKKKKEEERKKSGDVKVPAWLFAVYPGSENIDFC